MLHVLGSDEFKASNIELSSRLRVSLHRYAIDQGLFYYCTDAADPPRIVAPYASNNGYFMRRMTHAINCNGAPS